MSLRINTNVATLNAQRNLSVSDMTLRKSLERLSSGLRINRAADDAAGLAISEKLRAQVNGLNQARDNSQTAVNLVQTAEGTLNEVQAILQRQRTLAVQGASDTLTASDRTNIQAELDQLKAELDRIAGASSFNTKKLLDGSFTGMSFQVGASAGDIITVGIITISSTALTVNSLSVGSQTLASASIANIDTALDAVSAQRAKLGAIQNRLEHTIADLGVAAENMAASESRIRDTDFATEVAQMTRGQVLVQAGTAVLSQANSSAAAVLSLLR